MIKCSIKIFSLIFIYGLASSNVARGMSFLPDSSVVGAVTHNLRNTDGLTVDFAVDYAKTIDAKSLGGYLAPFGNNVFNLSKKPQNDLWLSNYVITNFGAAAAPQQVQVTLLPQAERYGLTPVFAYQDRDWFFGLIVPWRSVQHGMNVQFAAGNQQTSPEDVALVQSYFAGEYEHFDPLGTPQQAALIRGKVRQEVYHLAGPADVSLVVAKKNKMQKQTFDWQTVGFFLRVPAREVAVQAVLFEPQLGRSGSAQLGVFGVLHLPEVPLGQVYCAQQISGELSLHMPYKKILLPDVLGKGWGHAALVGIEDMPEVQALPLANLATQKQSIEASMAARCGYEAMVDYQGLQLHFSYIVSAEQGERVITHPEPEASGNRLGLLAADFYGGGNPLFGDDADDFEARRMDSWLGSKDLLYKPLRPALFGQQFGINIVKKIGYFSWNCSFQYSNFPRTRAFDSMNIVGGIGYDF